MSLSKENIMLQREERVFRPMFDMNIKTGFSPGGISFDQIKSYPYEEIPFDDYKHPIDLLREENPFSIEKYNSPKKTSIKKPLISQKNNSVFKTFNSAASGSVLLSGLVLDETGQPFPTATISVLGNAANGISTDFDGNFNLTVEKGDQVEVRFIGYKTLVFDWDKIPQSIQMEVDNNILDEVKLPDVKKKRNTLLYAGVGLGLLATAFLLSNNSDKKEGLNGVEGLTQKGRLKKGYKYGKGGGIIKSKQSVKAVNVTL
ncbi:MAG: carboxypeptidase-like regulatory domain-containing protein [Flavobacteriales bacterium]|nr:carboxypeptidase-like regulatory domain-containing protein [Flavobacteriales bacterium]